MKKTFTLLLFFAIALLAKAAPDKLFAAPTVPASNFTASTTEGDRITLNWTAGNGAKRIIIARKDVPVSAVPQAGVDYVANSAFGSGNEISTGEFVVYNSASTNVIVTNLLPGTTYYFSVFEYNGSGSTIQYLTTSTANHGITASAPAAQPSGLTISNLNGNSFKLSWTNPPPATAGAGRMVIAREGAPVNVNPQDLAIYSPNSSFGTGTQIGSGNYVIAKGASNNTTLIDLKPATTYYLAVFEYNGFTWSVFNVVNPPGVSATTAPRPTQASSSPTFSSVEGSSMQLSFTQGNGARRLIVAKAGSPVSSVPQDGVNYTANAAFVQGAQLASGEYVLANSTAAIVSVTSLQPNTTYYFSVFEYDGTGANTAYMTTPLQTSQSTAATPTMQATGLGTSNIGNSNATLTWTAGNGARHLVLLRAGSAVNATPVNLTPYSSSSTFGNGAQVGTGNYSVYNSTGNSVTVANLTAGTTYYASVFEFNGLNSPVYLTASSPTITFTTSQAPSTPASSIGFTGVEGNRMNISWNNGSGVKRIVVMKAGSPVTGVPQDGTNYTANVNFGNGDQLNAGEFVVMNGVAQSVTPTGLQPGTTYYVAVFEYNVVNNNTYYLTSSFASSSSVTVAYPTANSSGITFSNVTSNSMQLNWTAGNGARRVVLAKAGSPVDANPADFTSYLGSSSAFGNGVQIGSGNYAVYNSTGNTVTVSSLQPGTTYYFAVFEYNGFNYPVYLTSGIATASKATADRPSVASSSMSFTQTEGNFITVHWTNGNGTKHLLVGSAGSPVTALPQDGVTYLANTSFGNGSQIGTGQYILSDAATNDVKVTNLQPGITYYFTVFEEDGTGANVRYLTSSVLNGSNATVTAPAMGPSNVLFSSIGASSLVINWTGTTADRYLVLVRKDAPVTGTPAQFALYFGNTNYGLGTTLGNGDYIIAATAQTSTQLTNLQSNSTYHVSVMAYNGSTAPVYNTANVATGVVTTPGPPTVAASNAAFAKNGSSNSLNLSWINGDGQKRIVLMKAGAPVDALPVNLSSYTANTFFGSGQQVGTGNYVVYNGTSDHVTISNLQTGTSYYMAVIEYNQFVDGPSYLLSPIARGQFNLFLLPTKLQSFTGVAGATSNVLNWTTALEENTDRFEIERSQNGVSFEKIGSVAAAGSSKATKNYSFEDKTRFPVSYYRLHIVDAGGKSEYSSVLRLQTAKEEKLKLFPTLATTSVQITLPVQTKTTAVIRVIDVSGKVITQQSKAFDAGVITTTIDVSRLIAGQYILHVQMREASMSQRFVKQ